MTIFFSLLTPRPLTSTLFPYTTLFRSLEVAFLNGFAGYFGARQVTMLLWWRFYTAILLTVFGVRSEEHTSELQSLRHLVCRLLLEKKKKIITSAVITTVRNRLIAEESA